MPMNLPPVEIEVMSRPPILRVRVRLYAPIGHITFVPLMLRCARRWKRGQKRTARDRRRGRGQS